MDQSTLDDTAKTIDTTDDSLAVTDATVQVAKDAEAKRKATVAFVDKKKADMKKSQYRQKFDELFAEIDANIVNTSVSYGQKIYEQNGWGSAIFYNRMSNGAYDINVYPQKITDRNQNKSGVPVSAEPIAFSKILIATSVLAGKLPDATVESDDKIYSKVAYELWKRSWTMKGANGENTLSIVYQNLLTYGWAAWRVYPRRVSVQRKGVEKILFDDIYREPMDPARTWLGLGQSNGDYWSSFETYYERDMLKSEFFDKFPDAKSSARRLQYLSTSTEAKDENQEKAKHSVTIGYYENVLLNKYVVKCGGYIMYEGELPNDDSYGSIVVARCFIRNQLDPHGVGLYELMRGNTALFTYINSLNAQQVEAEIFPLLFGPQVQNGTNTYKRAPNVINPKNPGTTIDVVNTKGNVAQGIAYADKQKQAIEENTGVNNIIAGQNSETTLGSTVILKEAAYNRLTPPKNSVMNGLQTDAHIAWSWIQQTYSVDKVFMIDSGDKIQEFVKQNPGYFMQSDEIMNGEIPTGKSAVVASQNLRLNFDFTSEGDLQEDVPTRTVSSKKLFDEMKTYGHKSDYIEFIIDPDSMLLPSLEIQKQTFMALFPIITNQINQIYQIRPSDPELAASQLRALEQLLSIQKQDIYDYIPKSQYDAIIGMKPSQVPPPPTPEEPIDKTKLYKDAPADVQRQIEADAGYQPSQSNELPPQTPGTIPPFTNQRATAPVNMPGTSNNVGAPVAADSVPRPQSPMGSAVDASIGRAANLPFFPANQ